MRSPAAALAAAFLLLQAGAAPATSLTAPPPHDPKLACKAVKAVIAHFNAGRLRDPKVWAPRAAFFSDSFGRVEEDEEAAFLHGLRNSEGKPDRKPIRLYRVFRVHKDKDIPVYMVALQRESWHETSLVETEMLELERVRDPAYSIDTSYWLASFRSNDITDFREAPEMYRVMGGSTEVKNCSEDRG